VNELQNQCATILAFSSPFIINRTLGGDDEVNNPCSQENALGHFDMMLG
jgi:hypothetical protein